MPGNKLRILLITNGSHANRGDTIKNRKLVKILNSFSTDITLVTPATGEDIPELPKGSILDLGEQRGLARILLTQVAACLLLLKCRKTGRIDRVVFAFGMDLQIMPIVTSKIVAERTIVRSDGRPSLVYKRSYPGHKRLQRLLFRVIEEINYRLADSVLTECKYMISDNGFEKYRAGVGNLSVDVSVFSRRVPISKRTYDLGYVGRLTTLKGIMEFLDALEGMPREMKVVIVGDGDLQDGVRDRVSRMRHLGVAEVDYIPWVCHEELPRLLNDIKLLVIPSSKEGLPNILIEAMACGTAVLATPVGGIPDLVKDNKTGFIMKSLEPKDIAADISHALNRSDLEAITCNALEEVGNHFSYQEAVQAWRSIVKE